MCQLHSPLQPIAAAQDQTVPAAPAPAPALATLGRAPMVRERPAGRLKLWEIHHKYHCPIIGTCLHVDELRVIARKAGRLPHGVVTDYELHVTFVGAADGKNPLALAVQKALERKYAAAVRRFNQVREASALSRLWEDHLANGQVPEALWALMSHAHADAAVRHRAFEDVHMLSHQIGAGLSADIEALAQTRRALADLRRESAADSVRRAREAAAKDARITGLEQRVAQLAGCERALQQAREHIGDLESGDALRDLWARLTVMENDLFEQTRGRELAVRRLDSLQGVLQETEARADGLAARLAESETACALLEQLLVAAEPGVAECAGADCAACRRGEGGALDLGGRRILCVGGRGSLAVHYRTLVQRCNGELVRHDGGLEESRTRLEALLASADAVLCPADCVSHDAYLRAKRFCKRVAKPCVLIERSGISAFARALSDLAGHYQVETPINPACQLN